MKKLKHIREAEAIGNDSWALLNYEQLPKRASAARQVEALKADQDWLRTHCDAVSKCIDRLIADIRGF